MVPLAIFPDSPSIVEGKILYKSCDFVDPFFFARVLGEVQFFGYKFGLKGSTYTRENTQIQNPNRYVCMPKKAFQMYKQKSGFYDDCMKVTPSRSLKCFVAFSICSMLSVKTLIIEATYLFLWLLLRISSPSLRGPSSRYRVESSQSDPALLGWAWVCR